MIKQKITATAVCDDCGYKQKEAARYGDGFWGIVEKWRDDGWQIGEDVQSEPCYCPTCAERRECANNG